eukprot:NODE_7249_length_796_cov_35.396731_g6640_i0.p1 GENE.NODE_7249_length_796_cov_35.396731_g6640_i0~~NODE_7249_length_796_cov_35.396731_g6640_i0.p1  ORF type:complete len:169 (-),score=3.78 NODE_7249_length_796_cov_35.396731_g6640_i0:72-578(-)
MVKKTMKKCNYTYFRDVYLKVFMRMFNNDINGFEILNKLFTENQPFFIVKRKVIKGKEEHIPRLLNQKARARQVVLWILKNAEKLSDEKRQSSPVIQKNYQPLNHLRDMLQRSLYITMTEFVKKRTVEERVKAIHAQAFLHRKNIYATSAPKRKASRKSHITLPRAVK